MTTKLKFDNDLIGDTTPVTYSFELMSRIIARVADGETIKAMCLEDGMPNRQTFYEWLERDPKHKADYEQAQRLRAEKFVEEITDIADNATNDYMLSKHGEVLNPEAIARSKLRVDSRKWLASKLNPRVYGDKTTTEVTGANGAELIPAQSEVDIARRVALILAQGMKGVDNG